MNAMQRLYLFFKRQPRALLFALAVTSASLIGGAIPDLIGYLVTVSGQPAGAGAWLQLAFNIFGIGFTVLLVFLGARKKVDARVYSAGTVSPSSARKGLILLISTRSDTPEADIRASYNDAFAGAVNAQPWGAPVKAILEHQSKLEHLWLISSERSLPAAQILAAISRQQKYGLQVHADEKYSVTSEPNDAAAIQETQKIAALIFSEAERLGLSARQLVADITGSTKPMTLGLTFACLDATRDIQYAGGEGINIFGFETLVES